MQLHFINSTYTCNSRNIAIIRIFILFCNCTIYRILKLKMYSSVIGILKSILTKLFKSSKHNTLFVNIYKNRIYAP